MYSDDGVNIFSAPFQQRCCGLCQRTLVSFVLEGVAQLGVMATYHPPGIAGKRRIVADTARVEAGCP